MKTKIISIFSILFICLLTILVTPHKDSISDFRVRSSDTIIILEPTTPLSDVPTKEVCKELVSLINVYRTQNGLVPLVWSGDLESCAAVRADEIQKTWSHTRPDGSEWWTVNPDIMYGENLAKHYSSAIDVLNAWQNSPSHNANLLYANFQYVAIVEHNGYYACEFA